VKVDGDGAHEERTEPRQPRSGRGCGRGENPLDIANPHLRSVDETGPVRSRRRPDDRCIDLHARDLETRAPDVCNG
jgi:hypothetical protein